MKLLFVADPLETFKIHHDSTYLIIETFFKDNPSTEFYHTLNQDLLYCDKAVHARATPFRFIDESKRTNSWFETSDKELISLKDFDAVIMRTDPPFDMAYFFTTHLLTLAQKEGVRVYNRPSSLREYNEKLAILNYPEFNTPTMVTTRSQEVRNFLKEHKDIIVKPLDGMGGMGIFRLKVDGLNTGSILETLMKNDTVTIMAQKYIPEITDGDKRVLIVDGKAPPYTVVRLAQEGETRANLAAGGGWKIRKISESEKRIADTIIPKLVEDGIMIAGLDIIGECLTEINVTSPTCMQEIYHENGFNIAQYFVDAIKRDCKV